MTRDRQYFIDTRAVLHASVSVYILSEDHHSISDIAGGFCTANTVISLIEAGIPLCDDYRESAANLAQLVRRVVDTTEATEAHKKAAEVVIAVLESGLAEGGVH